MTHHVLCMLYMKHNRSDNEFTVSEAIFLLGRGHTILTSRELMWC